MAFQLTSSTQTADEMTAAIEHFGGRVAPPEPEPAAPADPKPAASASEPAPASGESPSGADGKPASASDAEETVTQGETGKEKPAASAQPDATPQQPGSKNFEPRRKQLERQLSRLHEDLEIERGGKAALQKQIEELNAKLAATQPPADAAPPQEAGPVKPKRPTLAECDFDNEKHELALESYDDQMLDYSRAIARKEFAEAQKVEREAEQKRKQEEAAAKTFNEFAERKEQQRADYDDWDDVIEAAGEVPLPQIVELSLIRSKVPADLIYYFAKDAINNGGKLLASISKLDDFSQIQEITWLESELVAERESRKSGKPAVAAVPPAAEPPKPAAPRKPAPPVVPPIEPVGSRAASKGATLASATNMKDYLRMRNNGVIR